MYGDIRPVYDDIKGILTDMGEETHSPTLFRDEIINEVCSVLISENKPNAMLIGPAGSGKTNIVEELARRIKRKDRRVPNKLYGYHVYSLNLSDIVSGSGLVGELERKVQRLIDFLENAENRAILFLDEIHMLFTGETYKKIAQILKPALSRGKFMVIAATTTQEVRRVDEDPAFNRRFTRVIVDELTKDQTKKILKRTVKGMEKHYGMKISFTTGMADLIVRTADEFCSVGSHRPDNAITLMDRAVASRVMEMQTDADSDEDMIKLDEKLVEDTAFRLISGNSSVKEFDADAFRQALSALRGQQEIMDDITRVITLYDMHIRPRIRPLTFLFAGASGVGKTEAVKIIAREYIGEKPIVLNMAEYHSSASINRIIGAPAGYAGADSNRELPFDILDTNPYQVILLDEFEKCDRSVQRLFLSVFEEGIMQTNLGKEIDFSKSIIIATTNAGSSNSSKSIGFGFGDNKGRQTFPDLSDCFDMELVNRFTHKYLFNSISKDVYREIIKDCLIAEIAGMRQGKIGKGLRKELDRALTEETVKSLCDSTYDPKYGARPARAAVTDYIDGILISSLSPVSAKKRSIKAEPAGKRQSVKRLKLKMLETEREKGVS